MHYRFLQLFFVIMQVNLYTNSKELQNSLKGSKQFKS